MESKRYIVILGAGESGTGAAVLAQKQGFEVFVSDAGPIAPQYVKELEDAGIAFEQLQHSVEKIESADEVIKSPGIPEKLSFTATGEPRACMQAARPFYF